jgi:hypothetical protein
MTGLFQFRDVVLVDCLGGIADFVMESGNDVMCEHNWSYIPATTTMFIQYKSNKKLGYEGNNDRFTFEPDW